VEVILQIKGDKLCDKIMSK